MKDLKELIQEKDGTFTCESAMGTCNRVHSLQNIEEVRRFCGEDVAFVLEEKGEAMNGCAGC